MILDRLYSFQGEAYSSTASQTVGSIVPSRQRQSLCRIPFAVVAHGASPAEMHHAQQLQKIFPVAEGDHSQRPSCSVEREYCPTDLKVTACPPKISPFYTLANYCKIGPAHEACQ